MVTRSKPRKDPKKAEEPARAPRPGDRIIVESERVGQAAREG